MIVYVENIKETTENILEQVNLRKSHVIVGTSL